MTASRQRFLNTMHGILVVNATGRVNAMVRKELEARMAHMGYYLTDRKFRDAYSELPVCSCDEGLFIPTHPTDLTEYQRYMTPKVGPAILAAKMERLRLAYPALAEQEREQPGLFSYVVRYAEDRP